MRPTIFISRDNRRSEVFTKIVQNASNHITCESLLDFSVIESTGLPKHGWLFFYSQTGVDFFLKQHSLDEVSASSLKIAAFGPKTSLYLKDQGIQVDFIGTGEANATSALFLLEDDLTSVCFIKGKNSKESLRALLEGIPKISTIDIYDNKGKQHMDIPLSDILVFTSPLNLETYYKHYPKKSSQKVVVIGTSTAMAALSTGIEEVHIPAQPSLESLATLVIELCDTWSTSK